MNTMELYELIYLNKARDNTKEIMSKLEITTDYIMDSAKVLAAHKSKTLVDLGEAYEKVKNAMSDIEEIISTIKWC